MGTRSITRVKENGQTLVVIYRQYDGYISHHGRQLADFLSRRRVVNGIPIGYETDVFNGPGCLAANLISFLKKPEFGEAGNIYIHPIDASDEDYSYDVDVVTRSSSRGFYDYEELPRVTVRLWDEELFSGTSEEFQDFVADKIHDEY